MNLIEVNKEKATFAKSEVKYSRIFLMYKANTRKSKLSTSLKFHSDFPQLSCIPSYSIVFRFLQRYSPYGAG